MRLIACLDKNTNVQKIQRLKAEVVGRVLSFNIDASYCMMAWTNCISMPDASKDLSAHKVVLSQLKKKKNQQVLVLFGIISQYYSSRLLIFISSA